MKKRNIIILIILFIILIGGITFYLIKNNKINDKERFATEYKEVTKDNVFVYRNASEIIKIMKNGTGIVYLGFPECIWCQQYVKYLNEVAKETGIEKIYYYNILNDRTNNTKEYKEIVNILKEELQYDEEGNPRIYVPNVSFHINGKIIANDYETSKDTKNLKEPQEYWTKDEIKDLKLKLKTYMEQVNSSLKTCTNCNE